jgi:cold shock protein
VSAHVLWARPIKTTGVTRAPNTGPLDPPDSGGKDVFVHISAVERAGLQGLNEGQKITYEVQAERGREVAVNLKV